MHAVSDVNATRDRVVMTAEAGTEGRERGPFSRTDRPASARRPRVGPMPPMSDLERRLREGNSRTREMRRFYCHDDNNPRVASTPSPTLTADRG